MQVTIKTHRGEIIYTGNWPFNFDMQVRLEINGRVYIIQSRILSVVNNEWVGQLVVVPEKEQYKIRINQ